MKIIAKDFHGVVVVVFSTTKNSVFDNVVGIHEYMYT